MTNSVRKSLIWSSFGEVTAKLFGPISTIILAHILTPNDFGVIAVCNMVLFFCDIVVDAGFGKYLVQHNFSSKKELYSFASTAFWANIITGILLWILIVLFKNELAHFLGKSEYANVIAVTSFQMLIVAAISPFLGLLRRMFKYRELSFVRIIASFIPLIVSVPIAFIYKTYWAMIIGSFCSYTCQLILVIYYSKFHPSFYFNLDKLRQMFSFSFWSLFEGIAHWLIFWIDTFILTRIFSSYYVGLYKNSSSIVMSIFMMIVSSVVPVLFSTLSRVDHPKKSYNIALGLERLVQYILFPISCILWFNQNLLTDLILGNSWSQAALIVGYWGIIMTVSVIFYSFPAEAFKAIGKPKILFFYQLSYLIILLPSCYLAALNGFWTFVNVRFYCIGFQIVLFFIYGRIVLRWSMVSFLKNMLRPLSLLLILTAFNIVCNGFFNQYLLLVSNGVLTIVILYGYKNDIFNLLKLINIDTEKLLK